MKNVLNKLTLIQKDCKCGKEVKNEFGGFKYRTVEQIYDSVKPLCEKQNCNITLSDSIELVGDRHYVKATATITDCESGEQYSVSAYAREDLERPKMCQAQVTGSCSSYARKYALGGLLLLDDNKDPDSQDNTKSVKPKKDYDFQEILPHGEGLIKAQRLACDIGLSDKDLTSGIKKKYGKNGLEELDDFQIAEINEWLEKKKKEKTK